MKFTGLFAAATLLTGVFGQLTNTTAVSNTTGAFNLTTVNGTWFFEGIPSNLLSSINTLYKITNVSISCPQVNLTGDTNDTIFFQPSLILNYFNSTSKKPGNATVSFGGLMTLNETQSATEATFNVSLVLPPGIKDYLVDDDKLPGPSMGSLTVGNLTDPLANGTDFTGFINVTLGSSNGSSKDVIFFTAYDFVSANATIDSMDSDDVFKGILVNENATTSGPLPPAEFNKTVTAFGSNASDIVQLNYTCPA